MVLLHISDIHFRRGEVGSAMDPNAHLRNMLLVDAGEMCRRVGAPTAVLISGDVAFAGHKDEYDFALGWLEEVCRRCQTPLSSVFVCPGNHDVVRAVANRSTVQSFHRDIKAASPVGLDGVLRGLLREEDAGKILYQSISPYNLFAVQFFCDLSAPERTIAKRDLELNDGSILRLWGLNSTFVSSEADRRGDLFVDPSYTQITRLTGVEHLVMCHHPTGWLRQEASVRDHLNDVARLQLFGHEHSNRVEMGRDWVHLAASAAHPDRTEPGWEPGYNLIEASVNGSDSNRRLDVNIHVRIWQNSPGRFRAKTDRDGTDVFRHTLTLDSWQRAPAPEVVADETTDTGGSTAILAEAVGSDPMSNLRSISVRFFKLTLSQKSAIAGKLGLLEDEDVDQPDFERFRRVFLRARERSLVDQLEQEITLVESAG